MHALRMSRREFLGIAGGLVFEGIFRHPEAPLFSGPVSDGRRGIYLTTWIAQSTNRGTRAGEIREHAIRLLTSTELNAVVIDVVVDRPFFPKSVSALVARLQQEKVWCIARIVVCQNNHCAKLHPKAVCIRRSTGRPWSCQGSIGIDPASPELVAYTVDMSRRAVDAGFDEVQYDYIRFPADCGPRDILYPVYDGISDRRAVIRVLCKEVAEGVRAYRPDIKLSIDVFCGAVFHGYGEVVKKDIGQDYAYLVDIFDCVCPMAYPSHYYPGSWNIAVPATEPYAILKKSLRFFVSHLGSTDARAMVRPWLQYFSLKSYRTDIHVPYDERMILEERRALDDLGIDGFCYWDPWCRYDRGAFRER